MNNLTDIKKIYIVGIEGAGTSALAQILHKRGCDVSGSDEGDHFYTKALSTAGITVHETYDREHITQDMDLVIYSTAQKKEQNSELLAAAHYHIPIVSYPEAIGLLLKEYYGIAVCGTHGKTTVTALLADIFVRAQQDPTVIVGGLVSQWKSNALIGAGQHFIVEADEYQNKLQYYEPTAAIMTNIDYDHPDYFSSQEEYMQVFRDFVARMPRHGFLVAFGDDANVRAVIADARCTVYTYGFEQHNDYVISRYDHFSDQDYETYDMQRKHMRMQKFDVTYKDHFYGTFALELPGRHNSLNALAAIACAHHFDVSLSTVTETVRTFRGAVRRFEYKGERDGVLYFDDYAHHPAEIRATLQAAREQFRTNRIWIVFHPHTNSRTRHFLADFCGAFGFADRVLILDVYSSAREDVGSVSSQDLVDGINESIAQKAHATSTVDDAVMYLTHNVGRGDVVITMGAGDVWRVHGEMNIK